jgi:hypothetical protein
MEIGHTFFPGKRTLITVTSGAQGTTLYLDAAAVETAADFGLKGHDCAGQLSLGAAAISYSDWNGDLYGLAIYNTSLTEPQVQRHYEEWNTQGRLKFDPAESAAAIFAFSERSGRITHNEVTGEPDLTAPATFQIPGRPFLDNPWQAAQSGDIGWKDVTVNVAGFIPFGFFLYSFLTSNRQYVMAGLTTIVMGVLVSLAIEVLQWHLPTRDSSMTDVITNGFGSAMGAAMYRRLFVPGSAPGPAPNQA